MVKYEPQFARAIGKWLLNNASASRLFFPDNIDIKNQWAPELRDLTRNNIAYEGLRKVDDYGKPELKGVSPVAIGDGPKWIEGNPTTSMMSLYSTSPIGIFGGIIDTTDVKGILRLDCNATDFFAERPYPVYLVYNPYDKDMTITYQTKQKADLFDIVGKRYIAKNVNGNKKIELPANQACVIFELPAGMELSVKDGKIVDQKNNIISYK